MGAGFIGFRGSGSLVPLDTTVPQHGGVKLRAPAYAFYKRHIT